MSRSTIALAAVVLLLAGGCSGADDPDISESEAASETGGAEGRSAGPEAVSDTAGVVTTGPADGPETGLSAYERAMLVTPAGATHLSFTDYAALRERLGFPDLTSEDIMTDRQEFWQTVGDNSVMLNGGHLLGQNSLYDRTYGFTQDDVAAEVRWNGLPPDPGFLLTMRPDLDLDLVQAAIDDDAPGLGEATLDRATATVLHNPGTGDVWANSRPAAARVGDVETETMMVRTGCVPFLDSLGVEATVEDQEAVLAKHDVEGLLEVEAVAIAFTGQQATIRLAYPVGTDELAIETDLAARVALAEDWPTTEMIGFSDGFDQPSAPEVDGDVGQVDYAVTNPGHASVMAMYDMVPLGVCPDVDLLPEPTGL